MKAEISYIHRKTVQKVYSLTDILITPKNPVTYPTPPFQLVSFLENLCYDFHDFFGAVSHCAIHEDRMFKILKLPHEFDIL